MDIKPVVYKAFQDTIENAEINSELKRSLMDNARVRGVVQNVYKEILAADAFRRAKGNKATSHAAIKSTAEDMAKMFIFGLVNEIEKRQQSDLARAMNEAKAQQAKDLESTANGVVAGDYQELAERGLKIGETMVDEA